MSQDTEIWSSKIEAINSPNEQLLLRYFASARVACGLENNETGTEQLMAEGTTMGSAWTAAADYVEKLIEVDPKQAFELGLYLTMLPRLGSSLWSEETSKWMRSDGPLILANTALIEQAAGYINDSTDESIKLLRAIIENISYDFAAVTKDGFYHDPDCFLAAATLYLCKEFGESEIDTTYPPYLGTLIQLASNKLAETEAIRVIEYYKEPDHTRWLAYALLEPGFVY